MGTSEAIVHVQLPDTPYAMWCRGELDDYLNLPERTWAEIVGGEIVVTPYDTLQHAFMAADIQDATAEARVEDPSYRWRYIRITGLSVAEFEDAFIPDLLLMDSDMFDAARRAKLRYVTPRHVEMAVEITSPSTAKYDRRPRKGGATFTKWSGYARAAIPWYLLVDGDPRYPAVTLYGDPSVADGTYRTLGTWMFGEVVRCPHSLGLLEIPTSDWRPWSD